MQKKDAKEGRKEKVKNRKLWKARKGDGKEGRKEGRKRREEGRKKKRKEWKEGRWLLGGATMELLQW
jgi:hypothetical protein